MQRVTGAAPMSVNDSPDPAPTLIGSITGQTCHMEGSITATASGSSSAAAVLRPWCLDATRAHDWHIGNDGASLIASWGRQPSGLCAKERLTVRGGFATTTATLPIRHIDTTSQHLTAGPKTLTGGYETELIEPTEHGQVRTGEGNVRTHSDKDAPKALHPQTRRASSLPVEVSKTRSKPVAVLHVVLR